MFHTFDIHKKKTDEIAKAKNGKQSAQNESVRYNLPYDSSLILCISYLSSPLLFQASNEAIISHFFQSKVR